MNGPERVIEDPRYRELLQLLDKLWACAHEYLLWSMARTFYKCKGRGAVTVIFDSDAHNGGEPSLHYLQLEALNRAAEDWGLMEDVHARVGEYNPEKEMVVVVATPSRTSWELLHGED